MGEEEEQQMLCGLMLLAWRFSAEQPGLKLAGLDRSGVAPG